MKSYIVRILYAVVGWFILLPLAAYCHHKKHPTLPKWAYSWDNEEDGYNGEKRGWYSRYLDKPVSAWNAYVWCAWRNPCWNIRYHKYASISVKKEDIHKLDHKGTVNSHEYVSGKQWYDTVINGKYKSHFRLIPISSSKSLYLRYGWKVYPHYYLEDLPLPKYKERSVFAISIRIRGK